MTDRRSVALGLLVALLVGSIVLPGSFADPYRTGGETPRYHVTHESTATFDEAVTSANIEGNDSVPVGELTPESRRLFESVYVNQSAAIYDDETWAESDVTVCAWRTLICPESDGGRELYDTEPTFPEHGEYSDTSLIRNSVSIVEYDTERYLVDTRHSAGASDDLAALFMWIFRAATFGPLAIVLWKTTRSVRAASPRVLAALSGYGVALAALGIVYPYVVMHTAVDAGRGRFALAPITWVVVALSWTQFTEPVPASTTTADSAAGYRRRFVDGLFGTQETPRLWLVQLVPFIALGPVGWLLVIEGAGQLIQLEPAYVLGPVLVGSFAASVAVAYKNWGYLFALLFAVAFWSGTVATIGVPTFSLLEQLRGILVWGGSLGVPIGSLGAAVGYGLRRYSHRGP